MNTAILPKIERMLKEGRKDEAREALREALTAPLTDEERGALLVGFAAAYLALSNSMSEARQDALHEEVTALEEVDALEREIDDRLRLAQVRQQLGGEA